MTNYFRANFATAPANSIAPTGLARWASNPLASALARSSALAQAVNAIAGVLPPSSSPNARILASSIYPSSDGIAKSLTSTSGRQLRKI